MYAGVWHGVYILYIFGWWYGLNSNTKKYKFLILCAIFIMANTMFASAQTEISVSGCSGCHGGLTFDASSVNRSLTCDATCHGNPQFPKAHSIGNFVMTDYGWFKSVSSANVVAPYVHDSVHMNDGGIFASCASYGCHATSTCSKCHDSDDVLHTTHGSNTIDAAYSCGSEFCHDLTTDQIETNVYLWTINQPKPACENCHNDNVAFSRHDITGVHQSTPALTPECQTCHSNYLPDTHAKIANRSYNNDSCAVCHQSTDTAVISAITNNDTSCASCHTLHGDITDSHTTTEGSGCMNCHSNQYLPDLHNNVDDFDTNCSVCHNNELIPTLPDTVECNECHGGGTLFPAHKNRENSPSSYNELTDMSSGRWSR